MNKSGFNRSLILTLSHSNVQSFEWFFKNCFMEDVRESIEKRTKKNLWKTAFKKFEVKQNHFTSNFLKAVFHNFYLAYSWILCPMYSPVSMMIRLLILLIVYPGSFFNISFCALLFDFLLYIDNTTFVSWAK